MIRILDPRRFAELRRSHEDRLSQVEEVVKPILEAVRERGDEALREYAHRFDGFHGDSFVVPPQRLRDAEAALDSDLSRSLRLAKRNIEAFAELQMPPEFMRELAPGHRIGQVIRPLGSIAAYVPGGRYPLPSTVLMTCVPARVAGVPDVWISTPKPDPTVLATASIVSDAKVALIGGAHAIAAFAFGTETIPKVDRIVGPGNAYVSAAKKLVAGETGIDFVAGPTEVVIIASDGNPEFIAADMLAQAEHDEDASAILLTTSTSLAETVAGAVQLQLQSLPTAATARVAIERNSAIVLCESVAEAVAISNRIAPEHLCLHDPTLVDQVENAGSIFLGQYSPEAAGDYLTGPNHVLPTNGRARQTGGLSVADFVKVITVQELTRDALGQLSAAGARIARSEGLEAHARSIEVRRA